MPLYHKARIEIAEHRLNVPCQVPFVAPFNKWMANVPGTTYFLPVAELTALYINVMLSVFDSDFAMFVWMTATATNPQVWPSLPAARRIRFTMIRPRGRLADGELYRDLDLRVRCDRARRHPSKPRIDVRRAWDWEASRTLPRIRSSGRLPWDFARKTSLFKNSSAWALEVPPGVQVPTPIGLEHNGNVLAQAILSTLLSGHGRGSVGVS